MNRFLTVTLFIVFIGIIGCKQDTPRIEIPESIKFPTYGKVNYISARSLVDSLNRGIKLDIYFIHEAIPENPDHIVMLPGMKIIPFSDGYTLSQSLSVDTPVYLICLYGDDSKKVADIMAVDGINSYCLDGGSYNLYNEIQKHRWKIIPQSNTP